MKILDNIVGGGGIIKLAARAVRLIIQKMEGKIMREMIPRRMFLKAIGLGTVSIAAFGLTGCGGGGGSTGSGTGGNTGGGTGGGTGGDAGGDSGDGGSGTGGDQGGSTVTVYNSPTGLTYGIFSKSTITGAGVEYKGFEQWTPEDKAKMAQVTPVSSSVWFPLTSAQDISSRNLPDEMTGMKLLCLDFDELVNESENKIVTFERSYSDFEKSKSDIWQAVSAASNPATTSYQSKCFTAAVGETSLMAISCGVVYTNIYTETVNEKATRIRPGEIGDILLYILAPEDWQILNVTYTPNWDAGKTFKFQIKSSEVKIRK